MDVNSNIIPFDYCHLLRSLALSLIFVGVGKYNVLGISKSSMYTNTMQQIVLEKLTVSS